MKTLTVTERKAIEIISYDYDGDFLTLVTTQGEFHLDAPTEAILRFHNNSEIFIKNSEEHIKIWVEDVAPGYDKSREVEMSWEDFVRNNEPKEHEIKHYTLKYMELWKRI